MLWDTVEGFSLILCHAGDAYSDTMGRGVTFPSDALGRGVIHHSDALGCKVMHHSDALGRAVMVSLIFWDVM